MRAMHEESTGDENVKKNWMLCLLYHGFTAQKLFIFSQIFTRTMLYCFHRQPMQTEPFSFSQDILITDASLLI